MEQRVKHSGDATLVPRRLSRDPAAARTRGCCRDGPPYGVEFSGKSTKHTAPSGGYIGPDDAEAAIEGVAVALGVAERGLVFPGIRLMWRYPEPYEVGAPCFPRLLFPGRSCNDGRWLKPREARQMARSVRIYYSNVSGRVAKNFNINGFDITNRSTVLVTAAPVEINAPPGLGFPSSFPDEARLNVHGPDVRVSNVVPHGPPAEATGVEFILTTDAPTGVAVTIILLEPWEAAFREG